MSQMYFEAGTGRERKENVPKDISEQFLTMEVVSFLEYLRTLRNEHSLSITIDWVDVPTARRLKAFIEGTAPNQERAATIRATEAQMRQEPNSFASGVKWEKVGS